MTSPSLTLRPRKQPSQARAAFTVDAILEATVHILEASPDGQFTTKQVAERSGVSIGSLYQYFPNKQALVAELVRRKLALLVDATRKACETAPAGYEEALRHVIANIIAEKQRNMRQSLALSPVMTGFEVQAIVRDYTAQVYDSLQTCIETRLDRALTPAEVDRLGIAINAVEGALSVMVKSDPNKLTQVGLIETLHRMFVATLGINTQDRS